MELIFASHNENKVSEIRRMLPVNISLLSLNDINYTEEIEETGDTLEANAKIKAETIFNYVGKPVFADDSGLFVESLAGAPGVFSARYAGTGNSADNILKLLDELRDKTNRNAYFRTVFCLISNHAEHYFDGEIHGKIIHQSIGTNGFGYDPIFVPDGYENTFAEFRSDEKNHISHRALALRKLITFIENF